jgi:hypothetical protein
MSPAADAAIKRLLNSGESESIYVGEALAEIGSNGGDEQTDDALIVSAQEIIASAQAFIDAINDKTP